MSYGKKYNYYFYWDHDSTKNYYEVAFYVDGYASTVTELTPSPSPLVINIKGQKDNLDKPIMGSDAQFSFIADKSDLSTLDADFLDRDYKEIIVKVIKDPSGTPVTEWVGIVEPEDCHRPYQGYKYNYNISGVDGLAQLKNTYYTSNGTETGGAYSGFEDMLTILKTALSKIADITELQRDFRIQLGTYSDLMTSTENAFKENEIAQELFYDKDGDPDTCYDVIQKILTPFYCSLVAFEDYFWIFNNAEYNSYYFEYDWATLTQQSRTAFDRTVDIFDAGVNTDLIGVGSLGKVKGYGYLDRMLFNRGYSGILILNSEFTDNITGWSNGDADNGSNQFSQVSAQTDTDGSKVLDATWGGSATAGSYNFSSTNTFNIEVGSGAANVQVKYAVKINSESRSGTSSPLVQMRLWNATNGYLQSNNIQQALITLGDYYIFTDTFLVTPLSVSANKLDVEIEITDATTNGSEFYFDYIRVNQLSVNNPTDFKIRSQIALTNLYPYKKQSDLDIYINDQYESSEDIFSIRDSGGTYTSLWTDYGAATEYELSFVYARFWFRDNGKPMNYVRTNVYDETKKIKPYSLLYDNTVRNKYYKIIGLSIDYRQADVMLDMKEVDVAGSLGSVYQSSFKQDTQYGGSIT